MNKIQVSSSSPEGPANYTFNVNPSIYKVGKSAHIIDSDIAPSFYFFQSQSFDYIPRSFIWTNYDVTHTSMAAVVTYFRSIEGQTRYFNFKDINSMNVWWDTAYTASASWKKARVIALNIDYKKGGRLKYEQVELVIQPER